jgi:hypothetical protein
MSSVTLPQPSAPLVDPRTGQASREWVRFFQQVLSQLGGSNGPSTQALEALIRELFAAMADRQVENAFASTPPAAPVDDIESLFGQPPMTKEDILEPISLAAELAELKKRVNDLETALAMK